MGFPEWTLWGMGIAAAGALIAISLSWLGQSPQLARSLGLSGTRLDRRVRALTGYALALLLLAFAFFLAGVPLGAQSDTLAEQDTELLESPEGSSASQDTAASADAGGQAATPATPETGAFSGPPVSGPSPEPPDPTTEPQVAEPSPTIDSSGQLTTTTSTPPPPPTTEAVLRPTETPTPLPTETPLPTLTPTVVSGETALVSTSGSTLWLKRSPGGQNVVLVRDGDVVLIRTGHANQAGILWREVATLSGVSGWLQAEFLNLPGQDSSG